MFTGFLQITAICSKPDKYFFKFIQIFFYPERSISQQSHHPVSYSMRSNEQVMKLTANKFIDTQTHGIWIAANRDSPSPSIRRECSGVSEYGAKQWRIPLANMKIESARVSSQEYSKLLTTIISNLA